MVRPPKSRPAIAGTPYPKSGLRVELERAEGRAPWRYTGHAATPDERFPIEAEVGEDGEVSVTSSRDEVAAKVRLILRSALKHAREDVPNAPPPRRIVRWRGPK
jgi:hypothetical protein